MDEITKEALRLLFECMEELRLHDEEYEHVTNPALKQHLQHFLVKHNLDNPQQVINKLCNP